MCKNSEILMQGSMLCGAARFEQFLGSVYIIIVSITSIISSFTTDNILFHDVYACMWDKWYDCLLVVVIV